MKRDQAPYLTHAPSQSSRPSVTRSLSQSLIYLQIAHFVTTQTSKSIKYSVKATLNKTKHRPVFTSTASFHHLLMRSSLLKLKFLNITHQPVKCQPCNQGWLGMRLQYAGMNICTSCTSAFKHR